MFGIGFFLDVLPAFLFVVVVVVMVVPVFSMGFFQYMKFLLTFLMAFCLCSRLIFKIIDF